MDGVLPRSQGPPHIDVGIRPLPIDPFPKEKYAIKTNEEKVFLWGNVYQGWKMQGSDWNSLGSFKWKPWVLDTRQIKKFPSSSPKLELRGIWKREQSPKTEAKPTITTGISEFAPWNSWRNLSSKNENQQSAYQGGDDVELKIMCFMD